MRAMYYMDMARMFANKTYGLDKNAETVPIITEQTALADLTNNPRATNEKMWNFIISDLDKAEEYLDGYTRTDITTPDKSVVYGLKARAYQVMEDWVNAERYAKLAQEGYSMMSREEYLSRETASTRLTARGCLVCNSRVQTLSLLITMRMVRGDHSCTLRSTAQNADMLPVMATNSV